MYMQNDSEADFESVWKNRDSSLAEMKGFREFHLLRGPVSATEGCLPRTRVWARQDDFVAWTKSENFRAAHRNSARRRSSAIRSSRAFWSSKAPENGLN